MTETFFTTHKGIRVATRRAFVQQVIGERVLYSIHTYYEFSFKLPKFINKAKEINKQAGVEVIQVKKQMMKFDTEVRKIILDLPNSIEQQVYKLEWKEDKVTATYKISGHLLNATDIYKLHLAIKELFDDMKNIIKYNCIEYKCETGTPWKGIWPPKQPVLLNFSVHNLTSSS